MRSKFDIGRVGGSIPPRRGGIRPRRAGRVSRRVAWHPRSTRPGPGQEVISGADPRLRHTATISSPHNPRREAASASAIDPGCFGCVVLLSGRVWRLLHSPRPTGGPRVLPGAGTTTPETPRPQPRTPRHQKHPGHSPDTTTPETPRPPAPAKTPPTSTASHPRPLQRPPQPANSALPSDVSITLRICREIHRCYDAAVRSPNLGGPQGSESGGTTTRGESPDFGVAQLFQREPVS